MTSIYTQCFIKLAIPDFFADFGYVDDSAVLGFIVNKISDELNKMYICFCT